MSLTIKIRHGLLRLLQSATCCDQDPARAIVERALKNKGVVEITSEEELIRLRLLTDALIRKCWQEIQEYSERGLPRKIYTRSRRRRIKAETLRTQLRKLQWIDEPVVIVCTGPTEIPDELPAPVDAEMIPSSPNQVPIQLTEMEDRVLKYLIDRSAMRAMTEPIRVALNRLREHGLVAEGDNLWFITMAGQERMK